MKFKIRCSKSAYSDQNKDFLHFRLKLQAKKATESEFLQARVVGGQSPLQNFKRLYIGLKQFSIE